MDTVVSDCHSGEMMYHCLIIATWLSSVFQAWKGTSKGTKHSMRNTQHFSLMSLTKATLRQFHRSMLRRKDGRVRMTVAPLKKMTIPRMEFSAAVIATKVGKVLRLELQLQLQSSMFGQSVLKYITNITPVQSVIDTRHSYGTNILISPSRREIMS